MDERDTPESMRHLAASVTRASDGTTTVRIVALDGSAFEVGGPDLPEGEIGPVTAVLVRESGVEITFFHNGPMGAMPFRMEIPLAELPGNSPPR